jgi:predicted  nucleic acid-binding Zn-ribbon protein
MLNSLKVILDIQELDKKMIRLMRLKKGRLSELQHIDNLRNELKSQLGEKETEIQELSKTIASQESKTQDLKDRHKKLDVRLQAAKKVDEYHAINQEIVQADREIKATEQITSDLIDKKNMEEEFCTKINDSLQQSEEGSIALENEIQDSIRTFNREGSELKEKWEALAKTADPELLSIYRRLLNNKKDAVVVPISNGTCSGCHIAVTAQHQNTVHRAERLVFCEHCGRINYHYVEETPVTDGTEPGAKRRRRRTVAAT